MTTNNRKWHGCRATFNLYEAACLILDLNPYDGTEKDVGDIKERLLSEIEHGMREPDPRSRLSIMCGPQPEFRRYQLVAWCKKNHFKPLSLFPETPLPTRQKPESAGNKERESILKLLLLLAVDGYGFNPGSGRNSFTGEKSGSIEAIASKYGILIDRKTAKKYLDEAAGLFPEIRPKSSNT